MIALAAGDLGASPTIPVEMWAFTILTLTAGIGTALKGRYGWLAVGLFLLGLPWLVSTFLLASRAPPGRPPSTAPRSSPRPSAGPPGGWDGCAR